MTTACPAMTDAADLELSRELTAAISSEYFGKRFSVEEFDKWVLRCLEGAAELSNHAYYYHKFLKKIRQEGYPLSIFARSGLKPITAIEPSQVEHSNFDAKVLLTSGEELYVEVTCVKDGQFDLVQGEHKEKFGYADIFGVTTEEMREAIKHGVPHIGDAVDASDTIADCVEEVESRITAKIAKHYPANTILLVVIEDDLRDSTWKAIFSGIRRPIQTTFLNIYLVSVISRNSGRLC